MVSLYKRCEALGLVTDGTLVLPLTQQHVADALGLSLVHTNKTLARLRAQNLLSLSRRAACADEPAQRQPLRAAFRRRSDAAPDHLNGAGSSDAILTLRRAFALNAGGAEAMNAGRKGRRPAKSRVLEVLDDCPHHRRRRLYRQPYGASAARRRPARGRARQSFDRLPLGGAGRRGLCRRLRRRRAAGGSGDLRARRRSHCAFRGLDRGAGFGRRPARLLPEQHGALARPDRGRDRRRGQALRVLLDRRRLWRGFRRAGAGERAARPALALRRVEADDRADARGRLGGLRARLCGAALLQRRGRRSGGPLRPVHAARHPPDQSRLPGRHRRARQTRAVRRRLSDTATAPACATTSTSPIS